MTVEKVPLLPRSPKVEDFKVALSPRRIEEIKRTERIFKEAILIEKYPLLKPRSYSI